jgi:hypothetical protein
MYVWDCRYICRDNHLSNCCIIFIIVAEYTQMYLMNRMALAEHSNSLNVVLKRNSVTGKRLVKVACTVVICKMWRLAIVL